LPYVIKTIGNEKFALLGVTEPPPGLEYLPDLSRELSGIRIVPRLKHSTNGFQSQSPIKPHFCDVLRLRKRTPRYLRAKLDGSNVIILAGNIRPDNIPSVGNLPTVAAEQHGQSIARAVLTIAN